MAKVTMPLQSYDARGKFGDMVFTGWRPLRVVRAKAIPTQPRTSRQLAVRNILTSLSRSFGALTLQQIQDWNEYAAAHPRTDQMGVPFSPSGANMYTGLNFYRMDNGAAAATTPPTDPPVASIATLALGGAPATPANGETIAITWNGTEANADYVEIAVAGPFQTKARKPQESDWTHLVYTAGDVALTTMNTGNVDSYFWARVRYISAEGQTTIPQTLQFLSLAGV